MEKKAGIAAEPTPAAAAGVVEDTTVAAAGDSELLGRSRQDTSVQACN